MYGDQFGGLSFGSKIAMFLFYFFIINIQPLKNYAGKVAPVGKMLKSK